MVAIPALLIVLVALLSSLQACLQNRLRGEDICTDRQLCESFAPCDLVPCSTERNYVCYALKNCGASCCLKRYRNPCFGSQAFCRNHDMIQVRCPPVSFYCPAVPSNKSHVRCWGICSPFRPCTSY